MHCKAVIAACGFALGAGECVFLVRVGVQEHRKVFANRLIALCHQSLGRAAHNHPVAVRTREAHQGIAHCTAD